MYGQWRMAIMADERMRTERKRERVRHKKTIQEKCVQLVKCNS